MHFDYNWLKKTGEFATDEIVLLATASDGSTKRHTVQYQSIPQEVEAYAQTAAWDGSVQLGDASYTTVAEFDLFVAKTSDDAVFFNDGHMLYKGNLVITMEGYFAGGRTYVGSIREVESRLITERNSGKVSLPVITDKSISKTLSQAPHPHSRQWKKVTVSTSFKTEYLQSLEGIWSHVLDDNGVKISGRVLTETTGTLKTGGRNEPEFHARSMGKVFGRRVDLLEYFNLANSKKKPDKPTKSALDYSGPTKVAPGLWIQ